MGMITFSVENPSTGKFIVVHEIAYANTQTYPTLSNATLPFRMHIENNTGADNYITLASSSCAGFTEGRISPQTQLIDAFSANNASCLLYTSPSPRD